MRPASGSLILALCTAPILGIAAGFLSNGLIQGQFSAPAQLFDWIGAGLFLVVASLYWGSVIGVPAMLIIGLPLHTLLQQLRLTALPWYAVPGAVVGTVAYLACTAALELWYPIANAETLYESYSIRGTVLIGFWTAVVFWLIRRPDRDAPNPPTPPSS